jgi:putative hydrolase of the HAD superfamily
VEGAAGIEASSLAAVLFDADGVVQHPAVEWRDALASVLDSDADVDRFLRDLFAAEQPTLRGQGDFPSIVAEVLARWGCAGRSAHVLRVFQDIVVDRAVLQVVAELRQAGVCCALATNQNAHRARYMSDELGYARAFDHAFYSCDIGFTKPDPRFFRAVLDVFHRSRRQLGQAANFAGKPRPAPTGIQIKSPCVLCVGLMVGPETVSLVGGQIDFKDD